MCAGMKNAVPSFCSASQGEPGDLSPGFFPGSQKRGSGKREARGEGGDFFAQGGEGVVVVA